MIIFIDNDFRCYLENGDGRRSVETNSFDGKCKAYIEGYRFVPSGETWVRSDGVEFEGEMVSPAIDYSILEAIQSQYEADLTQMEDMQNALNILGVTE